MGSNKPTQNEIAQKELWHDPELAARYKFAEGLTGDYAYDVLTQMDLSNFRSPVRFLDLACGTGVVTKKALKILQESQGDRPLSKDEFTAADISEEMLKVLSSRAVAEEWPINEEAKTLKIAIADMTDTKLPSDGYTHLGCTFGPGNAPDPDRTLRECFRLLKAGGVVGLASWQVCGWWVDVKRAVNDVRSAAARKCSEGTGTVEDERLSKLPALGDFSKMFNNLAGVDLDKLRAEGVPEVELPRWDREDWFESRLEKAGFVDVKINIVQKSMTVDRDGVIQALKPILGLLKTFWTEKERNEVAGADWHGAINEWLKKRFQEPDVVDGKIEWDQWKALVITGKKPN